MLTRRRFGPVLIVVLVCACGDSTGPDEGSSSAAVTISPAADTLNALGDTATLSATVRDGSGSTVPDASTSWTSLDTTVAVLDGAARVVSVSNGTARIVATADGLADTATVLVRQVAAELRVPAPTDSIVPGDTIRPAATVVDSNGVAIDSITEFTWGSSDEVVASVDAAGSIAGHATGATTITIGHEELTASIAVTVDWLRLVSVSAGGRHTCGLTAGGDAYCWGYNSNGQAGDGTTTTHFAPKRVGGGLDLSSIDAGNWHVCGVTHEGDLYCWGSNTDGQVGVGDDLQSPTPLRVPLDVSFNAVSAGGLHTCALTSDGETYCWGDNDSGQVGNGTTGSAQYTPVRVAGDVTFASVSAGAGHTCGLADDGSAYCWGYNALGQLGLGSTGGTNTTPAPVTGGLVFETLSAGGGTCGVADDATAYCWGVDNHGEVGDGPDTTECMIDTFSHSCRTEPSPLDAQLSFADVVHGASGNGGHACAISMASDAYCWGHNTDGKIGNASPNESGYESPQSVAGAHQWQSISAGLDHTCGIALDGLTYCWGRNQDGQVGDGTEEPTRAQPTLVARQGT